MKIAILGYGTIGQGVVKIIDQMSSDLEVVKIFDFPSKRQLVGSRFTDNLDSILNDAAIETVVEVMGGETFACECIKKALKAHKNVVTANKEVVANHLDELNSLAKTNNKGFRFEASVGGGIPILRNIACNSQFDEISSIFGIINGTTNYILTQMNQGAAFEEALKKAQDLGFAESDPTADLEGLDMVRKIAILSDLAFQTKINPQMIWHYPIGKVNKAIMTFIKEQHYVLKYVASSVRIDKNLTILVEPTLVKVNNPLVGIDCENNTIIYRGLFNDLIQVSGKGAGSLPTASAVVSDVLALYEQPTLPYENKCSYFINQDLQKEGLYLTVRENEQPTFVKTSHEEIKEMKNLCFYARVWEDDNE